MSHANLSPSSAVRWLNCPGSVALDGAMPDKSSKFADEGTAAHELAERALTSGQPTAYFLGVYMDTDSGPIQVDDAMAEQVQKYVDYVRSIHGELLVEQRLSISHLTGEDDAHGTSDSVILTADELIIVDLKYGMGHRVNAEKNQQLMIYALAALEAFSFMGDFKDVRMVIHQPRLDHVSEWVLPVAELLAFGEHVKTLAQAALAYVGCSPLDVAAEALTPGEEQCRWCKAKATCPALASFVANTIADDFVDLEAAHDVAAKFTAGMESVRVQENTRLAALLAAAGLVDAWLKAVRSEAETRLHAGEQLPGFKLVQGKQGNRAWTDEDEAEQILKSMRLKQEEMYTFKLISPTQAEKVLKDSPKRWNRAKALIGQKPGSPTVVPESDKRPALVINPSADFVDETLEDLC